MSYPPATSELPAPTTLSRGQCILILVVAFLGWMFAGVHMAMTGLVMRTATTDLLPADIPEGIIGSWFGYLVCAFLLGAATGGYLFGLVGDRLGRAKAMALSILCYSVFSLFTYFVQTPLQLWLLRFLTCLGIGGMWPNGISLVSEAWPKISRPVLAGAIGTAANVGILCFALLTLTVLIDLNSWRWTFLVGGAPLILGVYTWLVVPESPKWIAVNQQSLASENIGKPGMGEIFSKPILKTTILGILCGTIPLFGGWGVSNWASAWSSEIGDSKKVAASSDSTDGATKTATDEQQPKSSSTNSKANPTLKSWTTISRSLPGSISSLLGGFLAAYLGRKRVYFCLSLGALICTQILFRLPSPNHEYFQLVNGCLGFFSGFFFGWLPLCLPEMFPTRLRATGAGVSFNFGRILTAIGVLVSAFALKELFEGQYATVGQITGFVYALGMILVFFMPDFSPKQLDD